MIIYRGTSTIFELMKYKVISIYLSVNNELSRDPLFYCNNKFIINLDNIDDLILKINLLKKDNYLIDEFNFLRKKMINYYEPINKNNLP